MRQLRISTLIAGIGLLVAACSGGTAGPTMMQSLGDGEGELDLIIWAGYAEDGSDVSRVRLGDARSKRKPAARSTRPSKPTPRRAYGCCSRVSTTAARFSGNATDRLMAAGDVAPVNVDLLENYDDVFEGLKLQPHNSLDGVPYGVAARTWSEPADVEHR